MHYPDNSLGILASLLQIFVKIFLFSIGIEWQVVFRTQVVLHFHEEVSFTP